MVSILLQTTPEEKDALMAELYAAGTAGIIDNDFVLEAFFDTREQAEACGLAGIVREHPPRDYVREFQDTWQPVEIGERLWLAPPWFGGPTPGGRLRLDYMPGMACGTGAHPCTQLCLEALDEIIRPGCRVVDVGCGSGILLRAAKLLGAERAVGCDIDFDAVRLAREAIPDQPLFAGSARCLRPASFDVVIANISSAAIDVLLGELERAARPGGRLVLSGFRETDTPVDAPARLRQGWACSVVTV